MTENRSRSDWCRLLEVGPQASPEELRKAFRRQTMLWHPDRFPQGSDLHAEAEARIKLINEAYAALLAMPRPVAQPVPPIPVPSGPPPQEGGALPPRRWIPLWLVIAGLGLGYGVLRRAPREAPRTPPPPVARPAAPMEAGPAPEAAPRPTTVVRTGGLVIFAPPPAEVESMGEEALRESEVFMRNALAVKNRLGQLNLQVPIHHSNDEIIVFGAYTIERAKAGRFGYVLCLPPGPPRILDGKRSVEEVVAEVVQALLSLDEAVPPKPD